MLSQTVRSLTPAFASLFGLSFVLNLFVFVSPLYTMQIYDRVLTSRNGTTLVMLSLIVLALFAAYAALEHFRSRALVQLGLCVDRALSEPAFEAAFRGALEAKGSQHILPIRDVETLRATLSGSLVPALMDAPWIPIYLGLCFILHPAIGLVATVGAAAILGVALLNERVTKNSLVRAAELGHGASERLAASLRNAEVIQAMGMAQAIRGEWRHRQRRALAYHTIAADWGGTLLAATKLLRLVLQCAVLGVGAYLAIHQNIAAGAIFAASLIMGRALAPIEGAVGQWKSFVSARSAFHRLGTALKPASAGSEVMTLPHPAGPLRVEGLSVRAPNGQALLLQNVSFEVEPGEVAAVVGLTGSGKSSLARALVGVWNPDQGVVRLDGNDIRHFSDEQRGRIFGYLPQDVELFAGSVRDNITRFDPAATDDAAVAAASAASAHDLIQNFPAGYTTQIGDDGAILSGGQRQRIGLARALYGQPALVVLDEPNANLDTDGDAALARALSGLRAAGAIVVVITHRPQLLSQVDKIILMQKGQAVRVGLRDEILPVLLQPGVGPRVRPPQGGAVRRLEPHSVARWARR
ncbi:type I secretion system permease/ATPase [Bosea sp. NBC_00550]|uniref:type I secretion system permease/ATPase n=1 Tax=Bosea sp. NBC_00550 TaxID=2969621 RepID=UPI002231C4FF|nr:type I secretion system permease/ATPase [Bosea sp. NBC_00550]UZF91597.1 type I secretion system permease/ATPase [Bosea sp. NBC_00550]